MLKQLLFIMILVIYFISQRKSADRVQINTTIITCSSQLILANAFVVIADRYMLRINDTLIRTFIDIGNRIHFIFIDTESMFSVFTFC